MVATSELRDLNFQKINFENEKIFSETVLKARDSLRDLKEAFFLITIDFYKSEKAIFNLKSKGGYVDLSPRYKARKKLALGSAYPILKWSGRLEKSITTPNSSESIRKVGKDFAIIGTTVPYANFHNSDNPRNKIPQRKFVFIGPEVSWFNSMDRKNKGGRLTRWSAIIEKTVESKLGRLKF